MTLPSESLIKALNELAVTMREQAAAMEKVARPLDAQLLRIESKIDRLLREFEADDSYFQTDV